LSARTFACTDLPDTKFTFNDDCVNLDQFGPYYSDNLNHCIAISVCDDSDDDSDFTARDMCCKCGGGLTVGESSTSTECVDNLLDQCLNMDVPSFWYMLYVRGLFEYLASLTDFEDRVRNLLTHDSLDITINMGSAAKQELVEWVVNGSMKTSMVDGNWDLMPGYPHPRGRTGCEYLASYEIKSLLGVDLCAPESFMSIKFLCPQVCGCTQSAFRSDPITNQYAEVADIMIFTFDKAALTECPASCALPHPSISGSTAFENYPADV